MRNFIQSKIIILNGLIVSSNPVILLLSYYLIFLRKQLYIYWHTTEWHWKGLFPKNEGLLGIIISKMFNQLTKNSINIAVSNYGKKWIEEKFQLKNEVRLLYNTIDFRRIIKLSKKPTIEYFNDKYKIITAIGFLTLRKGFDIFLSIVEHVPDKFRFIWIGKKEKLDESFNQKIRSINENSGYEKIKIVNFTQNPYSILKKSDIFFLPSRDEPFGLVYLEAFALGKFVISPTTTGFSEIIKKDNLAFIYKNIKEVIELLNSKNIDYYIYNFNEERANLAKKYDNKQFYRTLINILKCYN